MALKQRVYEIVQTARSGDSTSRAFDLIIISLILLNVLAFILSTEDIVLAAAPQAFHIFEAFSVAVFTIEYLLRLWSCTAEPAYRHPLFGRLRFAFRPMILIDLLAILPFFLPFIGLDLRVLRILRVMRLARILKLARYSAALTLIIDVLKAKREELIVTTSFVAVLMVVAASLIYFVERDAQPETFGSVPRAMWWAVATLTTVGYGDVYPVTPLGRVLGALIAFLGIGLFALPTAILGSGFVEAISERRTQG